MRYGGARSRSSERAVASAPVEKSFWNRTVEGTGFARAVVTRAAVYKLPRTDAT